MGLFTFRWPHAAEEVYVTGTFDNWSKSVQLDKVGDVFEKTILLPEVTEKILYKSRIGQYVVDGRWVINTTSAQEKDLEGNENNVLRPQDIVKEGSATVTMNTVGPESITAQSAGQMEENKNDPSPPGGYPETPATELNKQFSVSPLPAAAFAVNPIDLAPGQPVPQEVKSQSVTSNVTLDKASYEQSSHLVGMDDQLPPVTSSMIPESSLPMAAGTDLPNTIPSFSTQDEPRGHNYSVGDDAVANDIFINSVGPASTTLGLAGQAPLEGPAGARDGAATSETMPGTFDINTVAPGSTTLGLAGQVPLEEPAVPAVVKDSKAKATVEPGNSEVHDKAVVEDELLSKVGQAPTTSEGIGGVGTQKSENDKSITENVGGALATVGSVALGTAIMATQSATAATQGAAAATKSVTQSAAHTAVDTAVDASVRFKEAIVNLVRENSGEEEHKNETVSPEVPTPVQDSIVEAHTSPEAAANTVAVQDKKEVEAQLLMEVKAVEPHATEDDKPKPVSSDVPVTVKDSINQSHGSPEAASDTAAVHDKKEVEAELLKEVEEIEPAATGNDDLKTVVSPEVPAAVKDSITESHNSPEAAANTAAVHDKKNAEDELLKQVKPVEPVEPASVTAAETSAVKPEDESEPAPATTVAVPRIETSGTEPMNTPAKVPTPPEMTPTGSHASASSPATTDKKKKNRVSMLFSKFKTKVSSPKDKA